MLPLADTTESGIEIKKWVERLLEILMEGYERIEIWVLQHRVIERMNIHDMDE